MPIGQSVSRLLIGYWCTGWFSGGGEKGLSVCPESFQARDVTKIELLAFVLIVSRGILGRYLHAAYRVSHAIPPPIDIMSPQQESTRDASLLLPVPVLESQPLRKLKGER